MFSGEGGGELELYTVPPLPVDASYWFYGQLQKNWFTEYCDTTSLIYSIEIGQLLAVTSTLQLFDVWS